MVKTMLKWLFFPWRWVKCWAEGGHIWTYGPDGRQCQECGRRHRNSYFGR